MARFKRRRPRVVWLPVYGRDFFEGTEGGDNFGNGIGGDLAVAPDGAIYTEFQPCTFDYSNPSSYEEGVDFRSLHDLTSGNSYRLRRLVGKFHAGVVYDVTEGNFSYAPTVDLAAGFIINKTDPSGNPLVSGAIGSSDQTVFGPLAEDGAEDPWIWRRRWILSSIGPNNITMAPSGTAQGWGSTFGTTKGQALFPNTTAGYGSVADGPHIDQKTARVIGPQERLFFWVQARVVAPDGSMYTPHVLYQTDLRILASLRFQQGNKRNASR